MHDNMATKHSNPAATERIDSELMRFMVNIYCLREDIRHKCTQNPSVGKKQLAYADKDISKPIPLIILFHEFKCTLIYNQDKATLVFKWYIIISSTIYTSTLCIKNLTIMLL